MSSAVLKLRITGPVGAYKVLAQLGEENAEADLGPLPERASLQPLQDSLLRNTEQLRNRRRAVSQPQNANVQSSQDQARQIPAAGIPASNIIVGAAQNLAGFAQNLVAGAAQNVVGAAQNFVAGADIKIIQNIGTTLFESLFQKDVYVLYKKSLTDLQKTAGPVPIKLYVEPPELAYVPWEALYDAKGLFHLCCYGPTPFARTASLNDVDLYIYERLPIRILGVISAPRAFIGTRFEINAAAEQAALNLAIQPLADVKLCWTSSGTISELTRRLAQGDSGQRWDVLLFIGHGFERNIVMEEEGGSGVELLRADVLMGFLSQPLGPKLVILNSCRGATVEDGDRFSSTAETLVRGGRIASVVAMQFDISDLMATEFTPAFFRNLMLGVPIQQAMYLTRLQLQNRGFSEWITPVLYMQNKNGLVMPPNQMADVGTTNGR